MRVVEGMRLVEIPGSVSRRIQGKYLGEGGRGQDEPFGASGQEVSEPEVKQGKGDQAGSKSAAASVGLMLNASLRLLPPAVGLSPRQHSSHTHATFNVHPNINLADVTTKPTRGLPPSRPGLPA